MINFQYIIEIFCQLCSVEYYFQADGTELIHFDLHHLVEDHYENVLNHLDHYLLRMVLQQSHRRISQRPRPQIHPISKTDAKYTQNAGSN